MLELCVFSSLQVKQGNFFLNTYNMLPRLPQGVGVFVPIFCPTGGALACICHICCDKCPWVPGGRPLGLAADTRINAMLPPKVPVTEGISLLVRLRVNPLSPGVKLQILVLCFHTFLTEVVGRSC